MSEKKEVRIKIDPDFAISEVDKRIFGGFLEHLGRAVYEGVYDPDSPNADSQGFRKDVVEALKRLSFTVLRYPGGNFASGYHWMDGIGTISSRPIIRDLAWNSIEPNKFGTDEFMMFCKKIGCEPMLTLNMGTGTPEEARNWVEYCNCPAGTKYADLRVLNGNKEPYKVKLWCIGNEMDGNWQLGHLPAKDYAIKAQMTIKMIKDTDPTVEAIICGSCSPGLPTYIEWDRETLEYIENYADYISLHRYVGNLENNTKDYLAVGVSIDKQIEEIDTVCRFVQAKLRSKKRTYLCFDEWNVWYRDRDINGNGKFAPHLLEETYNMEDALVVAQFLNSFIRHANVLKIANLAQIVNVIAPIKTTKDKILLQTIFYTFEMFSKRRTGISLLPSVSGYTYESKNYGRINAIDCSVIMGNDLLHLFLVNRMEEKIPTILDLSAIQSPKIYFDKGELLHHSDHKAENSFRNPYKVVPRKITNMRIDRKKAFLHLPPLSLSAITFRFA